MEPEKTKPNVDMSKTATSGVSGKDWVKRLEAATGRPVELGGAAHVSGVGVTTNTEQRTVQFRCAETGKPFFVLFTRYGPSHKFQLVSVSKNPETPSSRCQQHASGTPDHRQKSFDASDFDWTGWFCPHCGHEETFCQCARCHEYVCGKRVRRLQDGTQTFACHDGCGETGVMTGNIESFKASQGHTSGPNQPVLDRFSPTTRTLPQGRGHLLPPDARGT